MKAAILAAGRGGGLKHLTEETAKVMVRVSGEPMLTYCLESITEAGINEIVIVIGYRGDDIKEYYGSSYDGVPLRYVWQQEQLGTAHALLQAKEFFHEDFLLSFGDNISEFNIEKLIAKHKETNAVATLLAQKVQTEKAKEMGVCKLDEEGKIDAFVEKPDNPPSRMALRGMFMCSPLIFPACELTTKSDFGEYELTNAFDILQYTGRLLEFVELTEWIVNINTPDDVEEAEGLLKK